MVLLFRNGGVRVCSSTLLRNFDVFLTVHHSIDLFHLLTLMHNSFIH